MFVIGLDISGSTSFVDVKLDRQVQGSLMELKCSQLLSLTGKYWRVLLSEVQSNKFITRFAEDTVEIVIKKISLFQGISYK